MKAILLALLLLVGSAKAQAPVSDLKFKVICEKEFIVIIFLPMEKNIYKMSIPSTICGTHV